MKKILTGITVAMGLLMGSAAHAFEEGALSVWINGDKGYNGLQKVGDKFAKEMGVKVKVEHPDGVTDKFQKAASAGAGPDIFIWAHDRFGEWSTGGLIVPVNPSDAVKKDIAPFAWEAVTIGDKVWGYPIAVEAVGLIYNKALVPSAPQSFEEIIELDKSLATAGMKAILWDYNNTYFTWPLLAANGGYAFKKENGLYNPKLTGVNNEGAIAGVDMLKKLIDLKVMPVGADYGVMDAAVNKGDVAMMINGPWAWANLKKSGIDFGVAPVPAINGKPGKSFVGVLAATVNAASPNKDLAIEFLENHLLKIDGLRTVNADVPLGAVASQSFMKELESDEKIKATYEIAKAGVAMPNNPEMGKFWSAMKAALENVTNGRQEVKVALDDAASRILTK